VDQANTTQRQVVAGPPAADALPRLRHNIFDAGAAAIASGLCETVLITHDESGRSGVGRTRNVTAPTSLAGNPLPSLTASGGGLVWPFLKWSYRKRCTNAIVGVAIGGSWLWRVKGSSWLRKRLRN
jgi:hypothetical protein